MRRQRRAAWSRRRRTVATARPRAPSVGLARLASRLALALLLGLTACRRTAADGAAERAGTVVATARLDAAGVQAERPPRVHVPSLATGLPRRAAGFVADDDASEVGAPRDGAVHAVFTRGTARIHVTLAAYPVTAERWSSWLAASASFPQAPLPWAADVANGFYQCDEDVPPHCDLLIQLRAGFHLELRGGKTSRRSDVDELCAGLAAAF